MIFIVSQAEPAVTIVIPLSHRNPCGCYKGKRELNQKIFLLRGRSRRIDIKAQRR